jgi:adenine-specific DNA-methyltransferase
MQKLELTWIGKEQEPAVEPRVLLHDASKDCGDPNSDNMLIHGDNLLALKALEQEFAGRVKCIYIDPPYNTGSAFEHYDDNLEHSTWLSLMVPRLQILRSLLSEDGSIWISIDDDEHAYMKVLCDEVFGRVNFMASIIWQKRTSPDMRLPISTAHDYILVFAKNKELLKPTINKLPLGEGTTTNYKNPDNDPRGSWTSTDCTAQAGHGTKDQFYDMVTPAGRVIELPSDRCWRFTKTRMDEQIADGRIWFGADGNGVPRKKTFLSESKGVSAWTWWTNKEVGHNQEAKKEVIAFNAESVFATPKPERLIERVLTIASNPGDLVLDSFLGSGTTAAVAHKMKRRYIGIELGEHCYTHCLPRLQKVVDGEQGGISKSQDWSGGGGFKFYELAPTLIIMDAHGQPVISDKYNPQMLVAAVAKLNGFAYRPDAEVFWKQGISQDSSYIFVTTEYLTAAQLDDIARDLPEYERLLICTPAFDIGLGKRYDNIDVRKIPQSVLSKCEYDVDNYDLNIVNPPELDEEEWDNVEQ